MPEFDPTTARCRVFTYKEGLLSAVGHDVQLAVEKFTIDASPDQTSSSSPSGLRVRATFDPASLRVVCAMRDGTENPGALSDKDKHTIEGYVKEDILHARRYPKIEFRSTGIERQDDEWWLDGELQLHGRSRTIRARVTERGDEVVTRVRIHQPDFGITPFRAMLGTLRIQPHVDVEVVVPRSAMEGA